MLQLTSTPRLRITPDPGHRKPWLTFGAVLVLVGGVLALAGCSSVKTKVDTGPVAARTFTFMNPGTRTVPAYAESRVPVHPMIQEAITRNLTAKGVSAVKQGGDIIVAYLVIVGNNATTTSLNEYFGYGDEASALVAKVHNQQAVEAKNRNYFEAGTLVIDIIDAKTSRLLKRTSAQSQILRDLPLEARAERLQAVVDRALSDLRIAR